MCLVTIDDRQVQATLVVQDDVEFSGSVWWTAWMQTRDIANVGLYRLWNLATHSSPAPDGTLTKY